VTSSPAPSLDLLHRKARRLETRSRHLALSGYAGWYRSAFQGQGIEFADVREYTAGDDVRRIDWNVSARSSSLHVKTMAEERDRSVLVVLDTAATLAFGSRRRTKHDLALEIAAILTLAAFCARDRVSLALVGPGLERYLPPRKGWTHAARLVREMVAREPSGPPPSFEPVWRFLISPGVPRGLVLAVVDYQAGIEPSAALRAAARKHEIVALVVSDPRESELPDVGTIRLLAPDGREVRLVRTGRKSVRAAFARAAEERRRGLRDALASAGAECVEFSTASDPEVALRDFFAARIRRGYRRR
jgi:uncharacterized protein (DUF58 family)